jgi:peptide/nickel transport system ATP-binding protein
LENPAAVSSDPVFEVRNLGINFKRNRSFLDRKSPILVKAVDNVSFDVFQSETLSLVGESGSGKTTIARCLMALVSSYSGSAKFKGKEISQLRGTSLTEYRRQVQIIYQDPYESLNPAQNIYSVLSVPLRRLANLSSENVIKERAATLLTEVGLDTLQVMYKFPHQLSGGERQRVNIARALAPEPSVILADEPVTMLDASQRLGVLSLLMGLRKKRNLTIILITHDLASAKLASERTAIIYAGKIMEIGPTSTVLSKPNHPYTELILQATPKLKLDQVTARIDSRIGRAEQKPQIGCVFQPRCKYSTSICKEVEPQLLENEETHRVACYHPLAKS